MSEPEQRSGYDPPGRLRQLPSWLSGQLARKAERLVGDALTQEGARRQHFTVLTSLAEQGAASQATLGRRLWIDRSDLHAILNELERDGLIKRVRDGHDRRRNVVALTPRGSAALSAWTNGSTPRRTLCSSHCQRPTGASFAGCWSNSSTTLDDVARSTELDSTRAVRHEHPDRAGSHPSFARGREVPDGCFPWLPAASAGADHVAASEDAQASR